MSETILNGKTKVALPITGFVLLLATITTVISGAVGWKLTYENKQSIMEDRIKAVEANLVIEIAERKKADIEIMEKVDLVDAISTANKLFLVELGTNVQWIRGFLDPSYTYKEGGESASE